MLPHQQLLLGIEFSVLIALFSYFFSSWIVGKLKSRGFLSKDVNKVRWFAVEPGGIAPMVVFYLAMMVFVYYNPSIKVVAIAFSMLAISFFGFIDDFLKLGKVERFLYPFVASLPIVALKVGASSLFYVPFIGEVDLGDFYLFYVFFVFSISSNLTNVLAGFNGVETAMALVIAITYMFLGYYKGMYDVFFISLFYFSSLLGFLPFTVYKARAFPGDVLTLSTGAFASSLSIVYNLDWALFFLLIPYVLDLLFKVANGLPSHGWWGIYRNGKLYPPSKVVGFAQFLMRVLNGVEEKKLVLLLVLLEVFSSLLVLVFYAYVL